MLNSIQLRLWINTIHIRIIIGNYVVELYIPVI